MQNFMLIPNITLKFENNKVLNARAMNFKIISELLGHPLYHGFIWKIFVKNDSIQKFLNCTYKVLTMHIYSDS